MLRYWIWASEYIDGDINIYENYDLYCIYRKELIISRIRNFEYSRLGYDFMNEWMRKTTNNKYIFTTL